MLMMIKRSNRGKLSGSLGGRGSSRHDRERAIRRSFGMVAISALAAVAVALFAAVPAFADVSLGAPEYSKTATLDPATGKINITLCVTGNTDTSESKSSANLIVVLDTSGSMNEGVDKVSNPDKSKTYYVQRNNYKWYAVSYRWHLLGGHGWYDSDGRKYDEDELFSSKTTRLDVAKSALYGLADQLISDNDSTVKISLETFSGNGNAPSEYYGGGQSASFKERVNKLTAEGGTNWTDALAKANDKAKEESSTPTYIVFLSDGKPTYSMNENGSRYGNGTENQSDNTISQFVTDAVNTANARPSNVLGFYAIYTGLDAADSMNRFASRTNASPNGQAIDGSNSDALQSAFSDIVKTIKTGISYTNVEITDTKSGYVDYVLPEGATDPVFTYQKNGVAWEDAPKASFDKDNGQVSWNLGSLKLDKDVTYSVSFEVTLKQEAYDEAARDELKDNQVPTNGPATLSYSTVITTTGQDPTVSDSNSIEITSPTVTVPTSILHVSKNWVKNGWDNVNLPSELQVKVKQDNKDNKYYDYKNVTLNASNNWSADVVVAAGPQGHTYSVVEDAPAGWDAVLPNKGATLQGLTTQKADQAITNTIKTAKLTITKSVAGNFGDTPKAFSFTLTDASGNAITNVKAADGTSDGVSLGNDGSFTLKNGQKLVVELPYGASYKVVENDPKGTNDTVDYITTIKATATGTTTDAGATTDAKERTASSPNDGITKDTTITYTNKRDVTPDVGVDLGSGAPYAAVFGGAGLAGVIWMVLKRRNSLGI